MKLQYARQIAARNNDNIRDKYVEQHDNTARPSDFSLHQKVLLMDQQFLHKNRKLAPKYKGPFTITKLMDVNVEIKNDHNNRKYIVHMNRIKPYTEKLLEHPVDEPHPLDLWKNIREEKGFEFYKVCDNNPLD